jgi:hypothetical protein
MLASGIAKATSGMKFSPRGKISLNLNPEAAFKFWLNFHDFGNKQRR